MNLSFFLPESAGSVDIEPEAWPFIAARALPTLLTILATVDETDARDEFVDADKTASRFLATLVINV